MLAASAGPNSNRGGRFSRGASAAQNWRRPPLVRNETSPYHGELGPPLYSYPWRSGTWREGSSCGADTSMSLRNPGPASGRSSGCWRTERAGRAGLRSSRSSWNDRAPRRLRGAALSGCSVGVGQRGATRSSRSSPTAGSVTRRSRGCRSGTTGVKSISSLPRPGRSFAGILRSSPRFGGRGGSWNVAFVVSSSNVREGSPNMRRHRARRTHGGQIRVRLLPADAASGPTARTRAP